MVIGRKKEQKGVASFDLQMILVTFIESEQSDDDKERVRGNCVHVE